MRYLHVRTKHMLKNTCSVIALISCLYGTETFASTVTVAADSPSDDVMRREAYAQQISTQVFRTRSLDVSRSGCRWLPHRFDDVHTHVWVDSPGSSSQLNGTVCVDTSSSAFLYNELGFHLSNPQFVNIQELYLLGGIPVGSPYTAATLIEDSDVVIDRTNIASYEYMQRVCVAADTLTVRQSIIDPLERIHFSVGSHILQVTSGNIQTKGLDALFETETPPTLCLADDTILRSKEIVLQSFDHNAQIHCNGLLQSTGGDITLDANGDIHIHKVAAYQSLNIRTRGKVIFHDRVIIGGDLKIDAANVDIDGEIIVQGKTELTVIDSITVAGVLTCRNDAALAAKTVLNSNTLTADAQLVINALRMFNAGTVVVLGNFIPNTIFENQSTGVLDLQHAPQAFGMLVERNKGKIDIHESVNCTESMLTVGDGNVCIHGALHLQGDRFINNGNVEALSGICINMSGTVQNNFYLRTLCDLNINANELTNSATSRIFAFGILNLSLISRYQDDGHVYSPTLCNIQVTGMAASIILGSQYHFEGGDARFQSASTMRVSSGAQFKVKEYISFVTKAECFHRGHVKKDQNHPFNFEAYYPEKLKTPINRTAFNRLVSEVARRNSDTYRTEMQRIHRGRKGTVVYMIDHNLDRYEGNDTVDAGSIEYAVRGRLIKMNATKSGVFTDDDIRISAQEALIQRGEYTAKGAINIIIKDLLALCQVNLSATAIAIDASEAAVDLQDVKMLGTVSVSIIADQLRTRNVIMKSNGRIHVIARQADILHDSTVLAPDYEVLVRERMDVQYSTFDGMGIIRASDLSLSGTRFTRNISLDIANTLALSGVSAVERLEAAAQRILLDELNTAAALNIRAPIIVNTGRVITQDSTMMFTDQLRQLGAIESERGIVIEAEHLEDTERSSILGRSVQLRADRFKGRIRAEEEAVVDLAEHEHLPDLLERVQTRSLTAFLPGEVRIEEDLAVQYNLRLYAQRLENKARLTACKELIIQVQEDILNTGVIVGHDIVGFVAERGTFTNMGSVGTNGALAIQARSIQHGIQVITSDTSVYNPDATLSGNQIELIATAGNIISIGGRIRAGEYLKAMAVGSVIMDGTYISVSSGACEIVARDKVQMRAPKIDAYGNILVYGVNGVFVGDTHETTEQHYVEVASNSRKESHHVNVKSKGGVFISRTGTVTLQADIGNVEVTNIRIQASKAVLKSVEGFVKILLGRNQSQSSLSESGGDLFFDWGRFKQEEHLTFSACEFTGQLEIEAGRGILVEAVKDQTLKFLDHLNTHGGGITTAFLEEFHHSKEDSYLVPTKAFAAVVAVAVTALTSGIGAGAGAAIFGTTATGTAAIASAAVSAMTSAAISSVCSSAAIALLSCNGDLGKAAQQMVNNDTLKSIGIGILTAGIMGGLSAMIPTQAGSGGNFIKGSIIGAGVDIATGKSLEEVAIGVGVHGVANLTEGHVHLDRTSADFIKVGAAILGLVTGQDPNIFASLVGAAVYHPKHTPSEVLGDVNKFAESSFAAEPLSIDDQRAIDEVMKEYRTLDDADRSVKRAQAERMYAYLRDHVPSEYASEMPHLFETFAKQGIINQPQLASTATAIPAATGITLATLEGMAVVLAPEVIVGALIVGGCIYIAFDAIDYLSDKIAERYGAELKEFVHGALSKQSSNSNRVVPTSMPNMSTPGMPDPDDDQRHQSTRQEESYKTSELEKGDNIGVRRFTERLRNGVLRDPKTGQLLQKDRAINSGEGPHAGSYWKLFKSQKALERGKRIGTISKDGIWLRP